MTQAMTPERRGSDAILLWLAHIEEHQASKGLSLSDEELACLRVMQPGSPFFTVGDIRALKAELTRRDEVEAGLRQHIQLHAGDTLSLSNDVEQMRGLYLEECEETKRLRSQADGLAAALRDLVIQTEGLPVKHPQQIQQRVNARAQLATYDSGKEGK